MLLRIGYSMIADAEEKGLITPGKVREIDETTSHCNFFVASMLPRES